MKHIYNEKQFGENWFSYPELYSDIVNTFSSGSHFVEVGSWKGKSASYMAVEIANSGKDIKFDCVDTWEGSPSEDIHMNDKYVKQNKLYELFLENMKPVENYYTAIKNNSKEASKLYKNKSLDFVFIDAEHTYDAVKNDISYWYPKVKTGGILAGHDFNYPEVNSAVNDFFNFLNLTNKNITQIGTNFTFQVNSYKGNCWFVRL